jgi:glycine/D-amino acid oxidase-like deaminating enzyme/nitrite reductase/ring-hydroxylating ferredoxin subunit
MNVSSERSVSLWMQTAEVEQSPRLTHDLQVEVAVVGGGIVGLTAAYELACAGRQVAVLDRGAIAGGMSSRTSAHLTSALDDLYSELITLRSENDARLCYESQVAAIDRIEDIQSSEQIECDFRRLNGYLFCPAGTDRLVLEKEIEACHRLGFDGVSWAERAPTPGRDTGRCLRFPNQARFHPRKYFDGLVRCIKRNNGLLFANTPVTAVEEKDGRVLVATEDGKTVDAAFAVVATNSPINDRVAIHSKQAPYRTYVIAGRVPAGSVEDALIWDTEDPYHYVRIQPGDGRHDFLIAGGEDHKTGEASDMNERFDRLIAWTGRHFPSFDMDEYGWSGQVMDPVDFLPFIGRNPGNERIYVATGDSGQGLTNGTVAAILIKDLILGHANPWEALYDPTRVTFGASSRFLSENLTAVTNVAGYVTPGDLASIDDLKPGQGALVREGMKKVAAYRDDSGTIHKRSASCTHLGCLVHWNPFERCWDCPCHGSQFGPGGEVLNGPATHPLEK